jgi:hypothetical protein
MIEAIIASLASGAGSEAGKELSKRIGVRLGMLLKAKQAPVSATAAVEKLERGEVDHEGLRDAFSLLTEQDLAGIASEAQRVSNGGDIVANLNFQGAIITSASITGVSIGSRKD